MGSSRLPNESCEGKLSPSPDEMQKLDIERRIECARHLLGRVSLAPVPHSIDPWKDGRAQNRLETAASASPT